METGDHMDSPTVWLVIVLYNSYADTADCLQSLRAATYPALRTVLVDNGSGDGSGVRLREEFPEVTHIRSENNLGFAGGCNLGIRAALAAGADYVCLLNNDTLVGPGFLEPLVERTEATPGAGIFGGKIFYAEPAGRLWFAGGRIDRRRGLTTHIGQDLPDSPAFDRPREVDYITGCLLLAPAWLYKRLGLLDDRFFMYAEEVDFCLRARRAGYGCYYEPASVIRHRVSRSMGGAYRPLYSYYQVRNLLEAYRQHLDCGRLSLPMLRLAWHLAGYQGYIALRAHRGAAGPYLAALFTGWLDFLRGRFGPNSRSWLALK